MGRTARGRAVRSTREAATSRSSGPSTPLGTGFVALCVVAAVVLPVALEPWGLQQTKYGVLGTLVAMVVLSAVNTEIAKALVSGSHDTSPHRAPTAWALGAALLLPLPFLLVVVPLSYAHAWVRGMWPSRRRGLVSGAITLVAATTAGVVARTVKGSDPNWMMGDGGRGLVATVTAALALLLVETALLALSTMLGESDQDPARVRRALRRPSFYLIEVSMLLTGALSAAVWTGGWWFTFLLFPVCLLAQRALLHEPLRERAETDDKTGLLRFESWRTLALAEQHRCMTKNRGYSMVFADLDRFKAFNDAHGHIAGDAVLTRLADVLREELRSRDLVGRFGGEEFCFFLPDTPEEEATRVADRLRAAVERCEWSVAGVQITISLGVMAVGTDGPHPGFVELLAAADRALLQAKRTGRNRVCTGDPGSVSEGAPRVPGGSQA